MASISLTGDDTIIINGHVFNNLADGDVVDLTFPNDIAAVKTGKNGNSIYSLNEMGKQSECKIRVLRASADDKFLNGLLAQQQANFAGTVLMIGEFIKKVGDGLGNITADKYVMSGGVFSKIPEAKSNVEGTPEQSVAVYTLKFSNSPRAIT